MVASGKQSICMGILRSKYSVKENWLRAKPIKSASPTWRAIESAKKLIEKGACYLLGDDKSINVWVDPWVPWIEGFKLKPRIEEYNHLPIKAHHLFDRSTKSWGKSMVKEIFAPDDAQSILTIPIPLSPR